MLNLNDFEKEKKCHGAISVRESNELAAFVYRSRIEQQLVQLAIETFRLIQFQVHLTTNTQLNCVSLLRKY